MMFRGREQEACSRAINCMCEDVCLLLVYEKSELGFLLEDVLYMTFHGFKIDFQGEQVHWPWAEFT
jgi:hypothetical protein